MSNLHFCTSKKSYRKVSRLFFVVSQTLKHFEVVYWLKQYSRWKRQGHNEMNAGSIGSIWIYRIQGRKRQLQRWSLRICFKCGARSCGFGRRFEGSRLARVFCASFHVTMKNVQQSCHLRQGNSSLRSLCHRLSQKKQSFSHKFVWSWSNWSNEASNVFFPVATAKGSCERRAVIKHCLQRLSSKTAQLRQHTLIFFWNYPLKSCRAL